MGEVTVGCLLEVPPPFPLEALVTVLTFLEQVNACTRDRRRDGKK